MNALPIASPNLNGRVERFIQSINSDWMKRSTCALRFGDTSVPPEVRDCVATLLSNEAMELTPEWLAAVQPLLLQLSNG